VQRYNQALGDYHQTACAYKAFDPETLAAVKQTLSCH
jgi:hypothetical protein